MKSNKINKSVGHRLQYDIYLQSRKRLVAYSQRLTVRKLVDWKPKTFKDFLIENRDR